MGLIAVFMMTRLPEIRGGGGVGPGFFPTILGTLLFILAAVQTFITAGDRHRAKSGAEEVTFGAALRGSSRAVILILSIIAYALLFNIVGFPVMTFLMVFAMGILLERTDVRFKVLFALGFTVFAWIIFRLMLGIPLPAGILSVIL